MSTQKREHPIRRDQMTHHLRGVPQLPLRALHTLHPKIIPDRRTRAKRHTDSPTGFFSALLGRC